jgi:hypothetical protein
MFALITTFYNEKNVSRRNEFLQAIKCNVKNSHIIKIYILIESGEEFIKGIDSKIHIVHQEQRPKFQDLIKVANSLSSDFIRIIANTDVYFNETLAKAKKTKEKFVYCLTRWDLKSNGEIEFYPNFKSQDSWVFQNALPHNIGNYYLGVPGCDNRFAAELKNNGFKIYNPSLSIFSIHLHSSEIRSYHKVLDRVPGEYAYCLPIYLKNDVRHSSRDMLYCLVRRKYYNAVYKRSLESVEINLIEQIIAYFYLHYYKLILKLTWKH